MGKYVILKNKQIYTILGSTEGTGTNSTILLSPTSNQPKSDFMTQVISKLRTNKYSYEGLNEPCLRNPSKSKVKKKKDQLDRDLDFDENDEPELRMARGLDLQLLTRLVEERIHLGTGTF